MKGKTMDRFRRLATLAATALAVAAVVDQLRRPSNERTWHGEVGGIVPYDLRRPTVRRARSRLWNPDDDRLFVPQVFGVGWTLNLAQLGKLAGLRAA